MVLNCFTRSFKQ